MKAQAIRAESQGRLTRAGFTLVELIIVTALFVILGGALLTMFLAGRDSQMSAETSIQLQQEARRAFDPIVRELREARLSAGNPTTVLGNGSIQLNFQVALGYNLTATFPACPAAAICWGSENVPDQWVHYAIIDRGSASNQWQLIRCANADEAGGIRLVGCSTDPSLIEDARARILVQRRAEIARMEREVDLPAVRLVPPEDEKSSPGA